MKPCNLIAESLVMGEPLSDGDRAHVETCPECTALVAMPGRISAATAAPEPGPGFSARMTVGARERLATRRRQRVVGFGFAALAAAGLTFYVTQRASSSRSSHPVPTAGTDSPSPDPDRPAGGSDLDPPLDDAPVSDQEVRELLRMSSLERAMQPVAPWDEIEAPLRESQMVLARYGDAP